VFEVKLKREDGETDKRQIAHEVEDADGSERLTCDVGVWLSNRDGEAAVMHEGLILVETKSEGGESPADRALADLGVEPISLSKYRVGMGLVGGADDAPQPSSELFER
jgi:hypothetical protein